MLVIFSSTSHKFNFLVTTYKPGWRVQYESKIMKYIVMTGYFTLTELTINKLVNLKFLFILKLHSIKNSRLEKYKD